MLKFLTTWMTIVSTAAFPADCPWNPLGPQLSQVGSWQAVLPSVFIHSACPWGCITWVPCLTGVSFNNLPCAASKEITASHQRIGFGRMDLFMCYHHPRDFQGIIPWTSLTQAKVEKSENMRKREVGGGRKEGRKGDRQAGRQGGKNRGRQGGKLVQMQQMLTSLITKC